VTDANQPHGKQRALTAPRADKEARGRRRDHDPRTVDERASDHATIDRLTEELLPALVAKLSASGLAEIEVGEGSWTVRVRRPGDAVSGHGRRSTDRASRSQPGHAGHGHAPGGFEGHRLAREAKPGSTANSTNGSTPTTSEPINPGARANPGAPANPGAAANPGAPAPPAPRSSDDGPDRHRVVATSPAVGVYQPRTEAKPGTRVRSGDRLGAVDMLGIPQEVVAPADGIVGASLVEAGQAVEYGQELVIIELAARPAERSEV
jgi:biotin carboxyl carrier protein